MQPSKGQNNPFINNLEILDIFEDKDKEEGNSITDFISAVVRLLRRDINGLVKIAREVLELIKL